MIRLYTSPVFLTDAGFDLNALNLNEAGVYNLIHEVSSIIDSLTDQWFNAETGVYSFNGKDRPLVQHPKQIPIVDVTQVRVIGERTNYRDRSYSPAVNVPIPQHDQSRDGPLRKSLVTGAAGVLSVSEYVAHDRALERIRSPFPGGVRNVEVTGTLGWVEEAHTFSTTTTQEFGSNGTTISVADASGFQYRDVVDLISDTGSLRAIITNINRAGNSLSVGYRFGSRFIPQPIPAGAIIRTYGKVPRGIELVANYLVGGVIQEVLGRQGGNANPIDPARIKKERTDDYEYELFSAVEARSIITGSAKFDTILQSFTRPGGVRII